MANTQPGWPGWDIVQCIGKGGFGAVYELRQEVFGDVERCALKVITIPHDHSEIEYMRCEGLDDESISSTLESQVGDIVKEYKFMKKMGDNPNIVHCDEFRYSRHEEDLGWDIYIKMELLTPLMKVLDRMQDEKEIIRLGIELCNALVGCQKLNIIHRDIKPQNIFLSPSGYYKLGDFGIARTMEHTTKATAGIGTYSFMAPEVANGMIYGSTVDIYSLGLVLYWLLNERRGPFVPLPPNKPTYAENENARLRRYSGEKLPAPKHGSPELKSIVLKACAFDPKDRYQTAGEMMAALKQIRRSADKTNVAPAEKQENKTEKRSRDAETMEDTAKTVIDRAPVNPRTQKKLDISDYLQGLSVVEKIKKENEDRQTQKRIIWKKYTLIALPVAIILVLLLVFGLTRRNSKTEAQKIPQAEPARMQEMPKETTTATIPATTIPIAMVPSESTPVTEAEPSWKKNLLMNVPVDNEIKNVLGSEYQKHTIYSVTFLDSLADAPKNAWDVSQNKDRSVMAWVTDRNTDDIARYDLYIAADGGINGADACRGLFYNYTFLRKISFNGAFHTEDALSMHAMFSLCQDLESIDISELNTGTVTDMSDMFSGTGISKLNLSNFDTSNVTDMGSMFYCSEVEELDISSFNTSRVTNMSKMFSNCINLKFLDLSGFKTENVENMQMMFEKTHVETLDLSGFDTSNVRNMSYMFMNGNMKKLKLGVLDASGTENLSNFFSHCTDLEEIEFKKIITTGVQNFYGMFKECRKLKHLDLSGFDTSNATEMSTMFQYCTSLESLNVSSFDTSHLNTMHGMFLGCERLKVLDLRSFDTSDVTDMSSMFYGCSSLESLNINGFDTSKVTNMNGMFNKCTSLTDLDLSHFDFSKVTNKGGFMDDGKLVNGRPWEDLFS